MPLVTQIPRPIYHAAKIFQLIACNKRYRRDRIASNPVSRPDIVDIFLPRAPGGKASGAILEISVTKTALERWYRAIGDASINAQTLT